MATEPVRILLQTTIPSIEDDWSIARFSMLGALLREQRDDRGNALYEVTMRDRDEPGKPDSVLSTIDESGFDQLWLFAVDEGNGLAAEDREAISRFWKSGRGLLISRDHMDVGSSVCPLGGIGTAHHFHRTNPDPDVARRVIDDRYTAHILWPNYHSGANGDFKNIEIVGLAHPLLADTSSPTGSIQLLPAHPHEGGVSAPEGMGARVIARGRSTASGAEFNLAVAFEPDGQRGPGLADSTFHHFADYNWDTRLGCPSFVDEPPGDGAGRMREGMADTRRYALNIAGWLSAGIGDHRC
jgi:hypothetical protein